MNFEKLIKQVEQTHGFLQKKALSALNINLTLRNWIIGFYIVEFEQQGSDRAAYGKKLLQNMAKRLKHIRGLSYRNLITFRVFYLCYPKIAELFSGKTNLPFLNELKELQRQVNTLLFERTGLTDKDVITETDLENALLNHLQEFLLELGEGFCFEARQKRITIGNKYYRIDLVFYNRILKCHVLIELKTNEADYTAITQLNTYVSYYRKNIMQKGDMPTIGILLCINKDEAFVEYALAGLDEKIFISQYLLYIPAKEKLEQFIRQEIQNRKRKNKKTVAEL
ncbi:MAG: hypothetical protein B6I19_02580 [Bacteroidetes bacterium 4572_114]|nr:MAG: hypothetical protein B6I19_02580 [Bacteroidetes bacterium 4572_114]